MSTKNLNNIAVCLYTDTGINPGDSARLGEAFTESVIFEASCSSKYNALYKVSVLKRDYEISNDMTFKAVLCVYSPKLESIQDYLFPITDIDDICYYIKGGLDRFTYVSSDVFYCKSNIFDRIADFKFNAYATQFASTEEHKFYYHLKSLSLNTKCIYEENSSLFIWPAPKH